MKIIALTPAHVGPAEIRRRQARYDSFSSTDCPVVVLDQPDEPDVPRSFDTPDLIRSAARCVVARAWGLTLEPGDVLMPDCILDTALETVRSGIPGHALGILEITVSTLTGLGLRFGAVARNQAVADALTRRIRDYHPGDLFVGTRILALPTEAVADATTWGTALRRHVDELAAQGAQCVINGCSAVDVNDDSRSIPVIDPTRLAVRIVSTAAATGLPLPPLPAGGDRDGSVGHPDSPNHAADTRR
ncbi:aspartate/glutamate racemase family protein [Micromonospora sp. NPDC047740]|uniref:aspartate/glutamate racemase family protein n=1 Tax=Micromonospora sp. NPDC047740 TaxID=3364254 RepID=UPI00370FB569